MAVSDGSGAAASLLSWLLRHETRNRTERRNRLAVVVMRIRGHYATWPRRQRWCVHPVWSGGVTVSSGEYERLPKGRALQGGRGVQGAAARAGAGASLRRA